MKPTCSKWGFDPFDCPLYGGPECPYTCDRWEGEEMEAKDTVKDDKELQIRMEQTEIIWPIAEKVGMLKVVEMMINHLGVQKERHHPDSRIYITFDRNEWQAFLEKNFDEATLKKLEKNNGTR